MDTNATARFADGIKAGDVFEYGFDTVQAVQDAEKVGGLHVKVKCTVGIRTFYAWFPHTGSVKIITPEDHCGHDSCAQRRTCLYS